MSLSELTRHILFLSTLLIASNANAEVMSANLGTPLTFAEIERFSISVYPDGENLPEGQGTAEEGKMLYRQRCAMCHGKSGTEGPSHRLAGSVGLFSIWDPLRIKRIMETNGLLVMSTGQQWPYATTVFDFVRRAMPHTAPKSLTSNQVYALTAYILYLNDLIIENEVISRINLPGVEMPAAKRFEEASRQE
ncbi:MAG: cytochrome c [Gammaproteobacteria bacterium]|jgi:S-disulfanyl-L-cysteine oxidoreductase SoxD|nr:cytochrome c [Gammaproteobacteria bacterium]MBT4494977.1 cytochrome c [Gammaproteobacteria bacterium]MBT7371498.1 cytochrome c [Gammaproteobacteria bacterium]